jgi:4-amino-4-deoxy-L-arabinose transferase-like glycosyltransferase
MIKLVVSGDQMKGVTILLILHKVPIFLWVALLLRLCWVFLVPVEPVSDGFLYQAFAQSIAGGGGYAFPSPGGLTVYWAVGTSAFYALVFTLFGQSDFIAAFANISLGLGIVYLTYLLAFRYFDQTTAKRAAWIVAFWPVLVQFTTVYASEVLFIFLLVAALYAWGTYRWHLALRAILWGALLCAATYVRPTALPLFVLLPFLELCAHRKVRPALLSGLIASVTAAVLFAPWVVRNQQTFGHPVLVSANFGSNFWMGNNPLSNGGYMPLPPTKFDNDEVSRDKYFKQLAVDYIVANPAEYARLSLRRLIMTYEQETIGVAWNGALEKLLSKSELLYLKILSSLYWLICFAGALGWVLWAVFSKRVSALNPLLVVSAFFFVVPVLTVGQDRYHMPLIPFVAIFAALGLHAIQQYFLPKKTI